MYHTYLFKHINSLYMYNYTYIHTYVAALISYMVGVNKKVMYRSSNYDRITIATQLHYAL